MGVNESIRENVADVRVHPADLHASVGHSFAGTLTSAAASGYVTLVTVTSASTFFFGAVQVTAAGGSGGVSLTDIAGTALVNEIAISAAAANYTNFDTALSTTKILEIAAGGSLVALYTTGTDTTGFRAKWFAQCITTPT